MIKLSSGRPMPGNRDGARVVAKSKAHTILLLLLLCRTESEAVPDEVSSPWEDRPEVKSGMKSKDEYAEEMIREHFLSANGAAGSEHLFCQIEGRSFVANRLPGTRPQQPSENPQSASDKDKTTRKPSYPPVWFRIPLAFLFGFGANGPMIMAGFVRRTSLRWSLFGLGTLMFLGGMSLMLSLGFPATWGWPI